MTSNGLLLQEYRLNMTSRLADKAADTIREMIVENLFDPGEPLNEVGLAQMLGMSRTPIRQAITILEQEGLLRVIVGRGAFVEKLTREDIREVNELRVVLEPLAAVSALNVISVSEVDEHRRVWSRFLSRVQEGQNIPVKSLAERDDALHFMFISNCRNVRLRNFLRVLRYQIHRYVYKHWDTKKYVQETIEQHMNILDAFAARDASNVQLFMRRHIEYNDRYIDLYS